MWQQVLDAISLFSIRDLIDILIISYIAYRILMLIKETRAEQVLKGLVILLISTQLSEWLGLNTVNWLLRNAMTVGVIALLIVFQPELRRALERIGRAGLINVSLFMPSENDYNDTIEEIVKTVQSLSKGKIGALIVVAGKTGLNEITETGIRIDGKVSSELLNNIFVPNTPLHDGAVIIKDDRVIAAGCFLPLTDRQDINKQLGTRHRAAIGISEVSDALAIVVSEETGVISIAREGEFTRYLDSKMLRDVLTQMYAPGHGTKAFNWRIWEEWRGKHGQNMDDDEK